MWSSWTYTTTMAILTTLASTDSESMAESAVMWDRTIKQTFNSVSIHKHSSDMISILVPTPVYIIFSYCNPLEQYLLGLKNAFQFSNKFMIECQMTQLIDFPFHSLQNKLFVRSSY